MVYINKTPFLTLIGVLGITLGGIGPVQANGDFENSLINGSLFGEARYRYEDVSQNNFPPASNMVDASTIRANIGYKSGGFKGFQILVEGQFVGHIGDDNYNDTVNGRTVFPVIADPDTAEFNQFWLSWGGVPESKLTIGRQKINLDNQRFIGSVDWRQNDQTFDAIQYKNNSFENIELFYLYSNNVNRIQGNKHSLGDLDSNIHALNVAYTPYKTLKIAVYGYWMDFKQLAPRSSKTVGISATGSIAVNQEWNFSYKAEIATQSDYANNLAAYTETYYHIAPSISGYGLTFKAGYEVLGGDGINAFQTPLATLHKFNGWADAFLTTPANGLSDFYVSASYKIQDVNNIFNGLVFTSVYHMYDDMAALPGDYGEELNLSIGKTFGSLDFGPFKNFSILVKYADYNGKSNIPGRTKIWLQAGVGF